MPPKVVCIVGPTGCGKTGLGVALAERLGGEVVSCDSMQLYRGMVIGTAAPTEAETRDVPPPRPRRRRASRTTWSA